MSKEKEKKEMQSMKFLTKEESEAEKKDEKKEEKEDKKELDVKEHVDASCQPRRSIIGRI